MTEGTERYDWWFGEWETPAGHYDANETEDFIPREEVTRVYKELRPFNAPAVPNGYIYDCSCTSNIYAFVYRDQ